MPDPRVIGKDSANIPKGILVVVGGNEDRRHNLQVLRAIHSLVKKPNVLIEVITTASVEETVPPLNFCQSVQAERDRSSSLFRNFWIPAFADMTIFRCISRLRHSIETVVEKG